MLNQKSSSRATASAGRPAEAELAAWARAVASGRNAAIAPEAAVFAGGRLVYHGRIDDRFVDFGIDRPAFSCQVQLGNEMVKYLFRGDHIKPSV